MASSLCSLYLKNFFVLTDVLLSPCRTAAYYLPRHLAPNPAYPHPYPYLIRGFPDTAALENRQTLLNDYITSQQMHQWPAAAAMAAQRSDLLRGLTPRDQPLPLPYSAAPRGNSTTLTCFVLFFKEVCKTFLKKKQFLKVYYTSRSGFIE